MSERLPNLLGLDDESLAWRRMLCEMALLLGHATLVGNPAPMVARISDRLRNPQIGDYVFEASTFRRRRFDNGRTITAEGSGYLRRVADEYAHTDEEWVQIAEEWGSDERPKDRFWYVQYGPKATDECRWSNCVFQVVPLDEAIFDAAPAGIRQDDGSVVFTRDSLIGSLADAGFHLK